MSAMRTEAENSKSQAVDTAETEFVGLSRAEGDAPRERSCMVCGNKFESEGWHNRLCGSCRKRSVAVG